MTKTTALMKESFAKILPAIRTPIVATEGQRGDSCLFTDLFSTATPSTPAFRPWPSPGSHRSRRPSDLRVLDVCSMEWLSPFIHGLWLALAAGRSVCLHPINKLRACFPPTLRPKLYFCRCTSVISLEIARTFDNRHPLSLIHI